jgi:hypothetical protein
MAFKVSSKTSGDGGGIYFKGKKVPLIISFMMIMMMYCAQF